MSVSSRHSSFYVAEATYGVTPNTPALKTIRHTGFSGGMSKSTQESAELRADRNVAGVRHGIREVAGEVKGEVSYGSFDDFFEATLCGAWTAKAAPRTSTTISSAAADNSINDSGSLLPVLDVGDSVQIAGFTTTGVNCNGMFKVVSSTAAKLVIAKPDGSAFTAGTKTAGDSVTVTPQSYRLKNGVTRRSFSLLRYFSDLAALASPYHMFTGVEFNNLSVEIGVDSIVNLSFAVIGKDLGTAQTAPAGSTYPAATTSEAMNSNIALVSDSGVNIGTLTELKMTLENGLEPKKAVGSTTVISAATINKCRVSGELTIYFDDSALLNKFIGETSSTLKIEIPDRLGNKYVLILPNIKYNGGSPDVEEGEISITLPFQAIYDPTTGASIILDRHPGV